MSAAAHRVVVVVGGGFGGTRVIEGLAGADVEITLLDRRNFHLFQPLLYQVATGGLSPGEIGSPLRAIVTRHKNTRVLMGDVVEIDVARRIVRLSDGEVPYDELIVATGATHHYFGHDEWEPLAPGLKTMEDATEMRRRILLAFETAERETDAREREAWLTFVVVGAGPTGAELAGALSEIANDTLRHDFRSIHPRDSRIYWSRPPIACSAVSAGSVGGGPAPLTRLGVTVRLKTSVTAIEPDAVTFTVNGRTERIRTRTVLWAAGVAASPLARQLASATGAAVDRAGRIHVLPDLSLPDHPEIAVIGDMAHVDGTGPCWRASRRSRWPRAATRRSASCRASPVGRIRRSATRQGQRWRRSAVGRRRRTSGVAGSG